jgi:serine phosphatase RsbU (regulator of sigma subunit)
MARNDFIVVFSDGVTEAEDESGEQFGDERLLAAVADCRGATAQAVLERVLEDVRTFCGRALPVDDVTAMVVRYDGA